MKKYVLSSTEEVNGQNLKKWIQDFKPIQEKLWRLKEIYEAKDRIDKGTQRCDEGRPDNRVHSNLASMIVKNSSNYFMGKNPTYSFKEKKVGDQLKQYLFDSKEEKENKKLAKCLSKYGVGFELCAVDEDKLPYFTMLDPLNTFQVVKDDILHKTICFITFLEYTDTITNQPIVKGWVYTKDFIYSFEGNPKDQAFELTSDINPFKPMIPVAVFENNDERKGDYEDVIEPLNAYNRLLSNSFDDIEGILNAVFVIYNANVSEEEAKKLNKTRVLELLGENAKAEFLNKSLDENYITMLRKWLREDIFTITNVPDFTDEKFAGNQSGVALSYKLLGFENLRQEKVGYFKSGLIDRIEILLNYKNLGSKPIWLDEDDIKIQFYSNLPANLEKDKEIATLLTMGAISKQTALDKMEIVDDTEEELKRIAVELPEVDLNADEE